MATPKRYPLTTRLLRSAIGLTLITACSQPPSVEITEDVLDPLFIKELWTVIKSPDKRAIKLDHIRVKPPIFEPENMAGALELPAMIMPLGSIVELLIPTELSGEYTLDGAFAIDYVDQKKADPKLRAKVLFAIEVLNGETSRQACQVNMNIVGKNPTQVRWSKFLDDATSEPIRVAPGERVRFSAWLLEGPPKAIPKLGIAGLHLRRVLEVTKTKASPKRPNVVFVLMDTLRGNRTTGQGYGQQLTPHLDRLAERGTLYSNARSASSWTWPATASLFTGVAPLEHGVVRPAIAWLRSEYVTIAEHMRRGGMTTAAFTGNRLISADFHFDQGFETFRSPERPQFIDGEELVPAAFHWLDQHKDERFFLYLHLVDPHRTYEPIAESVEALPGVEPADYPKIPFTIDMAALTEEATQIPDRYQRELLGKYMRPRDLDWLDRGYDQVVHTGDYWLGQIQAKLDALDLGENTIVIFTSDHGEELYEHGQFSHGQSLYPELVHVPLVMAGPGIPDGQRVDKIVSTRGLYDYLGGLSEGVDPGTRLPLGEGLKDGETLFYSTERGSWGDAHNMLIIGVEGPRWVMHIQPENRSTKLFDKLADPELRHDVSAEFPAETAHFEKLLHEHSERAGKRQLATTEAEAGEGALQALKDIGYL